MIRETEKSRLELMPNNVVYQTYKEGNLIDQEEAERIIALVDEMLQGRRLMLLNDMRTKVTFNREARAYFRDHSPQDAIVAFVINSKIGEVAVNFFLKFNAPHYKLRVFHDIDEARAWIAEESKHP